MDPTEYVTVVVRKYVTIHVRFFFFCLSWYILTLPTMGLLERLYSAIAMKLSEMNQHDK